MSETTPLMEQYASIKQKYKNEVLFFRLGDFYEMFNEDAVEVSKLLNLTLTHRASQPMCGIPYHAAKVYIARLLRCGKKIAICEQIGPIAKKGLTERKVIEVITPGNTVEEEYLEQGNNNFLGCLCYVKIKDSVYASYSFADISTGAFFTKKWLVSSGKASESAKQNEIEQFAKELGRSMPRELILSLSLQQNPQIQQALAQFPSITVTFEQDWHFSQELSYKRLLSQFKTVNLRSFSLDEYSPEVSSAGYLLTYLSGTVNVFHPENPIPQITDLKIIDDGQYVLIDDASRRNLEITSNLRDGSVQFSLLETINCTVTAMGSRLMRRRLMYPLRDAKLINHRQERIRLFYNNRIELKNVRNALDNILDLERLASRIAMEKAHGKDLQALRVSLEGFISVRKEIKPLGLDANLELDTARKIIDDISAAIVDDPPTIITDGGIIKEGWSEELDHYRSVKNNFSTILDEYLEEEKAATGITNLKIKYSKNIGYFMEVSRGKISSVPSHFILRRSLVNGDRYTSVKLQELESELLTADEKIVETERRLFSELRRSIGEQTNYLLSIAAEVAELDVTSALAFAALQNNWCCPEVDDSDVLEIKGGRHPVVEYHLSDGEFVPNDTDLTSQRFAVVTGPNMAGKSTYLRQNALIVLLAQTGSFVPAESARIGVVDQIFCRVGASDNLARGESTFLVEMTETARILRSATAKSLVIMDEVGRGTSTEDGLSIAWAVSEYLLNEIKCKTLFATHYHELTRLSHPSLKLLCLEVLEQDGEIIFLKKLKDGAVENSYGIHVAELAGIPQAVIQRANQLLAGIQKDADHVGIADIQPAAEPKKPVNQYSGSLFGEEELIIDEILSSSIDEMTPLEALQKIAMWKKKLSGR